MKKKYITVIIIIVFVVSIALFMFLKFAGRTVNSSHASDKNVTSYKEDTIDEKEKMLDMETYFQIVSDNSGGNYQETDKSVVTIPYENLQLNQTKLYLKEGLQFSLRFQPDKYSKWNEIEDEFAFWNVLRKTAVWESSNEDVVTVKDGVVKAICQGEALITVRLEKFTYKCKIYVMSKDRDEEIPIQFNNDLFTKELYKSVKKIQTWGSGFELDITTRYGISSVFSMLAEYDRIKTMDDTSNTEYGGSLITLVLKNGEEIFIELKGMGEVKYNGQLYKLYYDSNASYGQANMLSLELAIWGPQLGSLEKL